MTQQLNNKNDSLIDKEGCLLDSVVGGRKVWS